MPKTCKTCKWWRPWEDHQYGSPPEFRYGNCYSMEAHDFGVDFDGTREDFGCIHHQPKKEEKDG